MEYGQDVQLADIELASPRTVSVTATASTLSPTRLGRKARSSFLITPLTAGVTVTISKSDEPAVANQGIVLIANQSYLESNADNFRCWQGALQVVASGNGSVAIVEVFER